MAHRHTAFWISALCLAVASCGSNPTQQSASSPVVITSEETIEEPSGEKVESALQKDSNSSAVRASGQTSAAEELSDFTIIPGERAGPITRDTSRSDLVDMFGEAALKDTEVPVGEGFTESGTAVNLNEGADFSVIWVDASQSRPATIKDFGTAWQTPEGIHVGTPFSELQEILGQFELYGFGWDYGGTVVLEGSELSNYYGSLILRLQPTDSTTFQQQPETFQAVQGDKILPSTDPHLTPLNLTVNEMIVYLNPPVE